MCDGTELDMKLLVGRRDRLAVRTLHRSAHRARKIRNGTRPFALSNLHFIGMIDQLVVGKRLEKLLRLRLVIVAPSCRLGLPGPKYGGVLGMPLIKGNSEPVIFIVLNCNIRPVLLVLRWHHLLDGGNS